MINKSLSTVVLLFVCMLVNAQAGHISLMSKKEATPIKFTTKSSSTYQLRLNIDKLSWKSEKARSGEMFSEIWFDKSNSVGDVGTPQLPAYKKLILLPLGATATARVVSSTQAEYSLKELGLNNPIVPVQPSMRKDQDSTQVPFQQRKDFYAKQTYLQNSLVTLEILGNMRSFTIARVVVTPVDYNPGASKIKVYNNIDIEINVLGGSKGAAETQGLTSPYFESFSKSMLNTTSSIYDNNPDKTKYPVKMLIISNRMFESSLVPFIAWKKQKGFNVITAYTDVIGSTSDQIKSYIQQQYNSATAENPAPTFLVFVGDVEQVPSSKIGGQSQRQTDLYYASVDGDMFPEMYYGRLSATTTQQLDNIISKILYYEKYQFVNPEYLNRVTLIAGDDGTWNPKVGQPTIKYGTANYFNPSKGFSIVNEYGVTTDPNNPLAQSGYTGCYDPDRIAVGFVNYTAHCGEKAWQGPSLTIPTVNAFSNLNKYPFTVANCCLSADFGTDECIGEAWLRAANKGAVTYIGSSPSSYWLEDMYWAVGAFPMVGNNDGYVPTFSETTIGGYDAPFVSNYNTAGAMVFAGNLAVTEVELKDYSRQINAQYYWEAYNILGDPSLMPYFTEASPNDITYDPTIIVGSNSINVNALEGTYVSITKNAEIIGTQYFDKTEEKAVLISTLDEPGELTVTATRAQTIPYVGTINAVAASGPYVSLNSITINDSEGNNNGKIDFGETVKVNLIVKNVGIAESTNTRVLIENKTGFATLTSNDSVFIGDINFEKDYNIATLTNAFTFDISSNTPDKTTEKFTLTFRSNEGEWTSTLSLKINAPNIAFGELLIDDSNTGNNNTVANFGETFYGVVSIKNTGNSNVNDLSIAFSIPDSISDQLILTTEPINNISIDVNETSYQRVKISVKPNSVFSKTYPLLVNVSSASNSTLSQEVVQYFVAKSDNVILMKNQAVSTCSSLFLDSGGELGSYADNENYVTTISSATGYSRVKVSFSIFDLESGYDFLYVFDGSSLNSKQVTGSPFSGSNLPSEILSSGNSLTFKFTSNGSGTRSGWKSVVSCIEPTAIPVCVTDPYPAHNSTNIFANKLSWTASENAQFYDVYLGNTTDNLALVKRVYESSISIALERNKDYYWKVIPGNYFGVCADVCNVWYFRTPSTMGDVLMGNGIISIDSTWFYDSGGSIANYMDNENYVLTFKPIKSGSKIKVEFQSFDVETHTACGYDNLMIYDGSSTEATLVNTYCGSSLPATLTSTSTNGELTFQFKSDDSYNNPGWKAKISSVSTQTYYTLSITVKSNSLPLLGASVVLNGLVKVTGTDGLVQFSVPQGNFNYSVNAAGYISKDVTDTNTGANQSLVIDLEKEYFSTVAILDNQSNQPIHGAKISANGNSYYSTPAGTAVVSTKLGNNAINVEKSGYNNLSSNLSVTTNYENFELKLNPKETTLTIIVKDAFGFPITSALVDIDGVSSATNSEGISTINAPYGVKHLLVSKPGFLTSNQWVNVVDNATVTVCLDYLQSELRDINLEIYGKSSLTVVPINGASLTIFKNGEQILSGTTSSSGKVRIKLTEGLYDYTIASEGYVSKDKIPLNVGAVSVGIKDTLILNSFSITFVIKSNGNALQGATVAMGGYGSKSTDANGTLVFDEVGYTKGLSYVVSKDGFQTYSGSTDITSNKSLNINLILTGIDDWDIEKTKLYPNPAYSIVYFKSSNQVELIQIVSMTGSVVKEVKPLSNDTVEIPINNLMQGTYITRIKYTNGKVTHMKLIKI